MTKIIITAIGCIVALLCHGQNPVVYSGQISEKVEISTSNGSMRFIEEYEPAKSYKLELKPAIIIWSFNNQTITFHGVKPAYRDQNGTLVFPVRVSKEDPLWVFMITRDGDKMWMEMDEVNKTMTGYYLR